MGSVLKAFRARYVFPVSEAPLADGVLTFDGERLVAVGRQAAGCKPRDLGNVAILPGFVNAHTHLEFSDLPQPISGDGIRFAKWVELVIESRKRRRPHQGIRVGLTDCARYGTTSLGEIARAGWPAADFQQAPIDATVFLELIGLAPDGIRDNLRQAREHLAAGSPGCGWRTGLSPHAPYTVHPRLLDDLVALSAANRVILAMHLAESPEELELLRTQRGPLVELLDSMDAWHPEVLGPGRRPLDYLQVLSRAHRVLVIHGNYLDDEEISLLASAADRMTVIFCPRSHWSFTNAEHPLPALLAAGASVAVGTDSMASQPDLSMLEDLRMITNEYPEIPPHVVLELGTVRAARALGLPEPAGQLKAGGFADLAIVHLPDHDAKDPHELLFDSPLQVAGTVFRGRIVHGEHALAATTGSS